MYADDTDLGARIKQLREERGLSQQGMATALGLHKSAGVHIESGSRKVTTRDLAIIAAYLGVSPMAILEPDGPLAKLAVAARVTTASPAAQEVTARAQALCELHEVLSAGGMTAPSAAEPPKVRVGHWAHDAEMLAEWACERLGDHANDSEALAEAIENAFGIDVLFEPHEGPPLGLTTVMSGFKLIYVNTSRPRRQALFTLAHELGHALAENTVTMHIDAKMFESGPEERVANRFAANLLLPEPDVRAAVGGRPLTAGVFLELLLRFRVSVQALAYRLGNLGLLNDQQRSRIVEMSATAIARLVTGNDELVQAVRRDSGSATYAYRPPGLLTARAYDGFLGGVVSVRPYAGLVRRDADDVLDELEAETSGAFT